ncbi:MAG: VOC family protein [Actinomycetota bacterium]|nr:VOC family protein [Actinomycetota bacterium]
MRLNHLNLTVTDVSAAKSFLQKYFGLTTESKAPDDERFCLLRDDNDMAIALMRGAPNAEVSYPGTFHIGFVQPNDQAVDAINQRLVKDGYDVAPARRFHGSWTFYLTAPGGFAVEVMA